MQSVSQSMNLWSVGQSPSRVCCPVSIGVGPLLPRCMMIRDQNWRLTLRGVLIYHLHPSFGTEVRNFLQRFSVGHRGWLTLLASVLKIRHRVTGDIRIKTSTWKISMWICCPSNNCRQSVHCTNLQDFVQGTRRFCSTRWGPLSHLMAWFLPECLSETKEGLRTNVICLERAQIIGDYVGVFPSQFLGSCCVKSPLTIATTCGNPGSSVVLRQ